MNKVSILCDNIPAGRYEGYLWKSDSPNPDIVLHNEMYDGLSLDPSVNPFYIEGNLFNTENGLSYYLRYVDGHYLIRATDTRTLDTSSASLVCYAANFDAGVSGLIFYRNWRIETDAHCNYYNTLVPGELVFLGFKK